MTIKYNVKRVNDDRHTRATETVEDLIDWKNSIQCKATIAPVKKSLRKVSLDTFIEIRLKRK